jgi:peptidoglycan/LPS O-acetylase OafA/YrhL
MAANLPPPPGNYRRSTGLALNEAVISGRSQVASEGRFAHRSPPSGAQPRVGHLAAIDIVRLVTIIGVIVVHGTSLASSQTSVAANAVLEVFHVTRSVFLFLSAFVLTYSFTHRPTTTRTFWRRRYPLIVVPYVVWSAVYFLTDGAARLSTKAVGTFLVDLLDGGAHFHLYFLLLTMQLYLVFPLLQAGLRRWPRALLPALWASLAFQVLFAAGVHYNWRPPLLGVWFSHPGSWLPSYPLYVLGGIAAARYLDPVTAWVRSHSSLIALAFVACVGLAIGSYLSDMTFLGYAPIKASEVFQPADVIEAVADLVALYAIGLQIVDHAPARLLRRLERSSDVSFGVFLAHPLVIEAILAVAASAGLSQLLATVPSGLTETLVVIGLVPFVYILSYAGIGLLRRTPLSVALTGRPAQAAL